MIDSYINIEKSHKSFDEDFVDLVLNKLVLKNVTNPSPINLVVTSLSKYGETKKNLSDFESTNKSFPTLIIADDNDFEQSVDKELTHCHILLRVPKFLKNKIKKLVRIIEKHLPPLFSVRLTKRTQQISVKYPTKRTHELNDNFDVY